MNALPGISGTLFPARYLVDGLPADTRLAENDSNLAERARRLRHWWTELEWTCGPASGIRAVFDLAAMPLFGMLGFRAREVVFDAAEVHATLVTPAGSRAALVMRPWSERPSALWKTPAVAARERGASWCFLFAPPFLSLLDARGRATRRSVEFTFPNAFDAPSAFRFLALAEASAFDGATSRSGSRRGLDALVECAGAFQDQVREDLQTGVVRALDALAEALRNVPASRRRSSTGRVLDPAAARRDEALAIVYRILFLLFAESRDLVPHAHPIYRRAYRLGTLCREAMDGRRTGLWQSLAAITRLSRIGCRTDDLVVRPFNGPLFARISAPSLEAGPADRPGRPDVAGRDDAMRRALVALGSRPGRSGHEEISYRDLGVEQLGAVYERVLDLEPDDGVRVPLRRPSETPPRPRISRNTRRHSARRKETGTFYTPRSLTEFVVRRTLAPLVHGLPADAILSLRVVDPAMGSGAFLVAACHYLADAYEHALLEEGRLGPLDLDEDERAAMRRLVAERCLAGVDRNPVAVQLARLSLWLTTLARGKPLGFLDHRLRVGNSLVGVAPDALSRAPGARVDRSGALPLFELDDLHGAIGHVMPPLEALTGTNDTVEDVRSKEAIWRRLNSTASPLDAWRQASNIWCAHWFWPRERSAGPPGAPEWRAIRDALLRRDTTLLAEHLRTRVAAAQAAACSHQFFHWPLEFADVFYDRAGQPAPRPGFDAVIGNPPWEMLRNDSPSRASDPSGDAADGGRLGRFIKESGIFPSCGRGHVNLYQPFVERALSLAKPGGRIGLVLPWGFATDDGAEQLRRLIFERTSVDVIVGLDNAAAMFPIHRGLRFLVLTTRQGAMTARLRARFGVKTAAELDGLPGVDEPADPSAYPALLTTAQMAAIGGARRRIPDLRRTGDLDLLERLAARFLPLGSAGGWNARFGRELNATDDRHRFGDHGLPVIEGKHIEPFRVDAAAPAARVSRAQLLTRFRDARFDRRRLGYRDVSGVGNRLSLIAAIVPAGVVTTHTIFCLRTAVSSRALFFLCGLFNSYVLNAVARLLMGTHLTTSLVEGLPAPPLTRDPACRTVAVLARRLTVRPNPEDAARLQAAVARLYGLDSTAFLRVLDGFPLVPKCERNRAAEAFNNR